MRKMKRSAIKSAGILLICVFCLTGFLKVRAADANVRLLKAEGSVSVQSGSGKDRERYASMELPGGNRVKTGSDSRVRIGVGREGELCLEACGALEVRTQGTVPEFLLERGMLFYELKGEPFNIRTAEAALTAEAAKGWIRVVDGQKTLICLEEGQLRCSVTDPVSGQVKSVRLKEGQTAECIVRLPLEEGRRCEIAVRALTEEDRALPVCNGRERADAARDPVWLQMPGNEHELAETEEAGTGTEEAASAEEEKSGRTGTGGTPSSGAAFASLPQTRMPAPAPAVPFSGGILAEEEQTSSSSGGGSHSGSGSSSASPSQPSQPAEPTQDQGLVLEGIVANEGTILVEESGKVTMDAAGQLMNYGTIVNKGTIDGTVVNGAGSFTMEGGSITRLANETVTRSARAQEKPEILINGGTVEEGVRVENGTFTIQGGTVEAPEGASGSALLLDGGATASIQGGTVKNGYGGAAIAAKNGAVSVKEGASVLAAEPLKTLDLSSAETVSVEYRTKEDACFQADAIGANGLPAFYVTAENADGLAELCAVDGRLEQAVQAVNGGKGDAITLAGDLADRSSEKLQLQGGAASAPVLLDLGGRTLTVAPDGSREVLLTGGASWEIRGKEKAGTLALEKTVIMVSEDSTLRITDATVRADDSEIAAGSYGVPEGNNNIILSGSAVSGVVICHETGGRLEISDSSVECRSVSDVEKTYGQLRMQGAVIEGNVTMNGAVTVISDSVIKGCLSNEGGALTAANSEVESQFGEPALWNRYGKVTVSGTRMSGDRIGNEGGTMTLSDETVVPGIWNTYGSSAEIRDCKVKGDINNTNSNDAGIGPASLLYTQHGQLDISNINDSDPDSVAPCRMKIFGSTITGSLWCSIDSDCEQESVVEVFGSEITGSTIGLSKNGSRLILSESKVYSDSMRAEDGGEIRILDKSTADIKQAMVVFGGTLFLSGSEAVLESGRLLLEDGGQMNVENRSLIRVPEIAVNNGGQLTVSDSQAVVGDGDVILFHSSSGEKGTLCLNLGAVMTIQGGAGKVEDANAGNVISIDGAVLNGRIVSAFRLELKGGADVRYNGTDPAVSFNMNQSPRGMHLGDCSLTNDGDGSGLRVIYTPGSLAWLQNLSSSIRAKTGNPVEVGSSAIGYGIPSGYEIEERDGYRYLVKSPSGASVRSADAVPEPEVSEPESPGPEDAEAVPEDSRGEKEDDAAVPEDSREEKEDDAVVPESGREEKEDAVVSPEEDAPDRTEEIRGAI